MRRSMLLFYWSLRADGRRLAYDWAREITVGIASTVVFATFAYVFNDFLNAQLATLSPALQRRSAAICAWVTLAIATGGSARCLRQTWRAAASWSRTAAYLGEAAATIRHYRLGRSGLIMGGIHALAWLVVQHWLLPRSTMDLCLTELMMVGCTLVLALRPGDAMVLTVGSEFPPHSPSASPTAILTTWRWRALVHRSRAARWCLAWSLPFYTIIILVASRHGPAFVAVAAAFAAGYILAAALCLQVADDLPQTWIERGLGVSHAQFVGAWERLGWRVGLGAGVGAALCYLSGMLLGDAPALGSWPTAATLLAVAALPAVSVPMLMLQIDARRPAINMLLVFIIGLFVGTAIFAHWLGLLLIPVLRYYALHSQDGRFYHS